MNMIIYIILLYDLYLDAMIYGYVVYLYLQDHFAFTAFKVTSFECLLERAPSYFENRFKQAKGAEYGEQVHKLLQKCKAELGSKPAARSTWQEILREIPVLSASPVAANSGATSSSVAIVAK